MKMTANDVKNRKRGCNHPPWLINKELSEICNWFKANKLSVNASKTNYMMLGTSHTTNKYAYESVDSSNDDVNSLTDIGINNGEYSVMQK